MRYFYNKLNKMKNIYLLIVICTLNCLAQERNQYKGRIIVTEVQAFPLKVINLTTKQQVSTDQGGYFSMNLQVDDILTLESNDYYQLSYVIKSSDLDQQIFRLYPESLNTVLKTIEINKISTKSLGIDSKQIAKTIPQKHYNMDFKAMFVWLFSKFKKDKIENVLELRGTNEQNPYVASLPKNIMTDYLKIPEHLIEKFYYFMNDDYIVDEYIRNNQEEKWRLYLLEKSFDFLKSEENQ